MNTNTMTHIGSFSVDSGQAMVGDPCYLDEWDTNSNEEWNITDKQGEYSYFGASATTLADCYGELGGSRAVVFSTGYGDGLYPVYAEIDDDNRVSKVIIDFMGEIGEEQE